ncbi:hypothetical protein EV182_007984 [Spiromyces aspiralis]|uniref:Uncharacterized protein n=1 Tax=Spiromyces aspiralis TaxID=68401 RepID=A0ACC1H7T0_9FUNG|nr:hypothetical protein EV182_007984 [Spiromyces aspiralis]
MTRYMGKLGEFFYGCPYDDYMIDALSLKRGRRGPLGHGAPIENLPVNILREIVSELSSYDICEFLLTSRLIAGKLYEELYSGLSWQGCRIACIGDYATNFPVRLACAGVEVEKKYHRAFDDYVNDNFQEIDMDMTDEIREAKIAEQTMTGKEDLDEFVVLNESRKEYVVTNRRNFTKVILSLICWSDDPSASMRTNHDITQGRWAWDQISIFSQDEFEPVAAKFEDTTEEVYETVREIVWEDTGRKFPSK